MLSTKTITLTTMKEMAIMIGTTGITIIKGIMVEDMITKMNTTIDKGDFKVEVDIS